MTMTEFTDKTDNFKRFIRMLSLPGSDAESGKNLFNEFCFTVKDDFVDVSVTNENRSAVGLLKYKPASVITGGSFWCNNTEELLKCIKTLDSDIIRVKCSESKIILSSGGTKVELNNVPSSDITSKDKAKKMTKNFKQVGEKANIGKETELGLHIHTDVAKFKKVTQNAKTTKHNTFYPFQVKDGVLSVKAETSFISITEEIGKLDGSDGSDFMNNYLVGFDNVFGNITGKVDVYLDPGMPIIVFADQANFNAIYLVVPYEPIESAEEEADETELPNDDESPEEETDE